MVALYDEKSYIFLIFNYFYLFIYIYTLLPAMAIIALRFPIIIYIIAFLSALMIMCPVALRS